MSQRTSSIASFENLENRQLLAAPEMTVMDTNNFNADLVEDIVGVTGRNTGGKGSQRLAIFLSTGAATYAAPATISFSRAGSITGIASGDFDNDGEQDLLVSSNGKIDGLTGGVRNKRSRIHLVRGNGDGTFDKPELVQLGGINEARMISTAQINGDGNLDLIIASRNQPNFPGGPNNGESLFSLIGNGDGTFQEATLIDEL